MAAAFIRGFLGGGSQGEFTTFSDPFYSWTKVEPWVH